MTYLPSGNGTYMHSQPCSIHGETAWFLDDDMVCLLCLNNEDTATTYMEAIAASLDLLAELAPKLPSRTRRVLHNDLEFALIALSTLLLATDVPA